MIKPLQKHCAHVCQGPFSFVGELLRAYTSLQRQKILLKLLTKGLVI